MNESYEYDRGIAAVWRWGMSQWLKRLERMLRFVSWQTPYKRVLSAWWWFEWLLLGAECCFVGEFVETLMRLSEPRIRRLTEYELVIAREVFGDSLDFSAVRIDANSYFIARRLKIAYVRMNTINCWVRMSDATFVHELVHVWQYQHYGALYIARALAAQQTNEGYNYGGLKGLESADYMLSFNFEQQGDLVEDWWRLSNGLDLKWSNRNVKVAEELKRITSDIQQPPKMV